ncbi:MAG TPA: DoxX family protein [Burkholderiales bacterium]|nr:DoxX family protein [Burkholderiales bacterium]
MNAGTRNIADLAGRILIAALFLIAGVGKLGAYAGTQGYMQSHGVPGALLPAVIALELGGGLLIVAGLWTRIAALALAGFTLLAALLFHANFSDATQQIMFLKNLAIAGGFLMLAANGAGAWSVDGRRSQARRPAIDAVARTSS